MESKQQGIKVKFCGVRSVEDVEKVNRLCPDYVGFVFYEKSKRFVTPEKASELKKLLHPKIQTVGVFVDEELSKVLRILEHGTLDGVQLHGRETEAYRRELRKQGDWNILQAICMKEHPDRSDRNTLLQMSSMTADYLLLDSGMGQGRTFDWKELAEMESELPPYFLAGGLHPGNVDAALQCLHPYAVDVSSGIEDEDGKSEAKMRAFLDAVRGNA